MISNAPPPQKLGMGAREARAPLCFVDEEGVLLSDLRYLLSPTSTNERLRHTIGEGALTQTAVPPSTFTSVPPDLIASGQSRGCALRGDHRPFNAERHRVPAG